MDQTPEFMEGWRASMAALSAATQPENIPFDDIPQPPKHITYVQMIISPNDGFFASCYECGADPFPDRKTLAEAEADAREHGELRHVYSREALLQHESHTNPKEERSGKEG